MAPAPSYTRLDVDERRRQLLDASAEIFTERNYDDVSMSAIAARAGISKGLLYHYFTSKEDLFRATLETAARELAESVAPDPALPPADRVRASLDAFLDWVEVHEASYVRLIQDGGSVSGVRELLAQVREGTATTIAAQAVDSPEPPRSLVTAALGWLWMMDGVCLDWLRHRHMAREQVREMLLGALFGVLMSAASADGSVELALT